MRGLLDLLHLTPRSTAQDGLYRSPCNTELPSDAALTPSLGRESANPWNVCLGQPRVSIRAATGRIASAFSDHVGHVLGMCPSPQVVRPNARRVVTAVEYVGSFGDWTVCQFPRVAMSVDEMPLLATHMKLTIPLSEPRSGPQPTAIRLLDVGPEALLGRLPVDDHTLGAMANVLGRLSVSFVWSRPHMGHYRVGEG
jgi:hypothetical protein